jgi:Homeodomain-like domain
VAEIFRRYQISRETYYRYRRPDLAAGIERLEDRSRRPKVSPGQIDAEVEVEICRMRREHPRWGARRIHGELRGAGWVPPAVSTIHQARRRNHLIANQPPRRPRRFSDQHRTRQGLVKTTRSLLAGSLIADARIGSGQLLSQGGREPLLVTLGRPPSVANEEAIDLGGHQRVDQVGCVAFSQSGLESTGASN